MDIRTILIILIPILAVGCLGWALWIISQREKAKILNSSRKALWLLYLFEVSLQASVSALYSERLRSKGLQDTCRETINRYEEFREEVQGKVKKRLVRKGIGAALSFVPGLALVDILSDLADMDSGVEDANDQIKEAEAAFYKFSKDWRVEFADISSDDEISIALTQDKREVFTNTFKWYIDPDLQILNASTVSSRVKDIIQNRDDVESITSMTDENIKDVVEDILREVEDYIKDSIRDHQVGKEEQQ